MSIGLKLTLCYWYKQKILAFLLHSNYILLFVHGILFVRIILHVILK